MANSITGLFKGVVVFTDSLDATTSSDDVPCQQGWLIQLPGASDGDATTTVNAELRTKLTAPAGGRIEFGENGQVPSIDGESSENVVTLRVSSDSSTHRSDIHKLFEELRCGASSTPTPKIPSWTPVQSWQREALENESQRHGSALDAGIRASSYQEAKKLLAKTTIVAVPYTLAHNTLVRSTDGTSMGAAGAQLPLLVSVDGMCKELLYKVGVAPKYGA